MSRTDVRLGMIGCGFISHAHGRAAAKSTRGVRFVSCASRRPEAAAAWASAHGAERHYVDYREMLERERLDGVVIATVPAAHREHIETVLAAGVRYVLCEKALTNSGDDALAVWRAAQAVAAHVVEGFMYRHHDVFRTVRALVDSGDLGRLDHMHGAFCLRDDGGGRAGGAPETWRRDPRAGGGVVHDFLCYPVDTSNAFAGALPVRVHAVGADAADGGTTDRLYGQIEYRNGCVASVTSSRRSTHRQSFYLAGAEGQLDVPVMWSIAGDVTLVKTTSPRFLALERSEYFCRAAEGSGPALIDWPVFTRQLENFAGVIRGEETAAITLAESVVNALVLDALLTSYRIGAPVDVSIPHAIEAAVPSARSSYDPAVLRGAGR